MEVSGTDYKKVEDLLSKSFSVDFDTDVLDYEGEYTSISSIRFEFLGFSIYKDVEDIFNEFHVLDLPKDTRLNIYQKGENIILTIYSLEKHLYIQTTIMNYNKAKFKNFKEIYQQNIRKKISIQLKCGSEAVMVNGKISLFNIHNERLSL